MNSNEVHNIALTTSNYDKEIANAILDIYNTMEMKGAISI
jgi:hypothetical protein